MYTGDVSGYLVESAAPKRRQKTDDGLVLLMMARAVAAYWPPDITSKNLSEVQSNYKRYLSVVDDRAALQGKVSAEVVENIHDVITKSALRETGEELYSSAGDCIFSVATLQRPSKPVSTFAVDITDLRQALLIIWGCHRRPIRRPSMGSSDKTGSYKLSRSLSTAYLEMLPSCGKVSQLRVKVSQSLKLTFQGVHM